jgi:hypothetical protein
MRTRLGSGRREEGIPDKKVMAFELRDLLPSDIALEMEGAEVTAKTKLSNYANTRFAK